MKRKKNKERNLTPAEYRRCWRSWESKKEIANQLGISEYMVRKIRVREAG